MILQCSQIEEPQHSLHCYWSGHAHRWGSSSTPGMSTGSCRSSRWRSLSTPCMSTFGCSAGRWRRHSTPCNATWACSAGRWRCHSLHHYFQRPLHDNAAMFKDGTTNTLLALWLDPAVHTDGGATAILMPPLDLAVPADGGPAALLALLLVPVNIGLNLIFLPWLSMG